MSIDIPLDKIKPSPYQPRLSFDLEDIRGSIKRDGILVALTVRKKDGYYELIDGERRWRVAKEEGYEAVPCDIIDIDDETARRMIWRVNTLRKDYTTEEKASYMKKLQEDGLGLREIGRITGYDHKAVGDYLNIFKLPDFYQKMVWDGKIGIGHIHELAPLFNKGGVYTPRIIEWLDEVLEKRLIAPELRKAISPELEELEEKRVEAAKEAVSEIIPEAKKPETPEELEEAAKALRERAKELKTPEQILEEKREKARKALLTGKGNVLSKVENAKGLGIDASEFEQRFEQIKAKIADNPDEAYKEARELKKDIDEAIKDFEREQLEAKIREEAKKEAKMEAKAELLEDKEFLKRAMEKGQEILEWPEIPRPVVVGAEPIQIPEDLRERAEQMRKEYEEFLKREDVQERGEIFHNWMAHYHMFAVLGSAKCPICKANWENLTWKCHHLNLKQSFEKLQQQMEG